MNAKARPPAAKHRIFAAISRMLHAAFDANGERRVSEKFRIWFRNGGRERSMPAIAPAARQSKIYGESNQSDFSLIFAELSSMQSLAIYRGLLVENHCGIDRNRFEKRQVARCFFCCAWRSGSGLCSCCCREKRRLNRRSCRKSAPRKP